VPGVLDPSKVEDVNTTYASASDFVSHISSSYSGYAAGELHVYRFADGNAGIWINTDSNTSFDVATDTFIVLVGVNTGAGALLVAQISALLI